MTGRLHPVWLASLPLLALAGLLWSQPEQRLLSVLLSASVCALVPWLLPQARFRTEAYFSPVNVALALLHLKLIAVPICLMNFGYQNKISALTPSLGSMEKAILIDTVAFVGFCIGLQFFSERPVNPGRYSLLPPLSGTPGRGFVVAFALLGLVGLFLTFGSVGRFLEYFSDPAAVVDQQGSASVGDFLGTVLRPFLAFALVTWWAGVADESRESGNRWRPALVGVAAAIGITIANMTFSFNRGAFVFPVLSLVAVYSTRIRRIPLVLTFAAVAACVPMLLAVASFRSNSQLAKVAPTATRESEDFMTDLAENVVVYCGGPQLTGVFYESLDWGDRLFGGVTLVSSLMSPIPILGKAFREDGGPIVYNKAIYGMSGIDDQIPPFASELFGNFHIAGVVAGFLGLAFLLATLESWTSVVGSTFGAFVLQYLAVWGAMLSVWSLSVYAQILFYFLGPVYLYLAVMQIRAWLRRAPAPEVLTYKGVAT
ncbi:MAG: hypothetical protein NTV52_17560 [Acidobacteria bacterium]|nr:hypothetical protein [Acidobacteriota bacterium]